MDASTLKTLLTAQRNEITEYRIYERLATLTKDPHNREVLERIARDELGHYRILERQTGKSMEPNALRAGFYVLVSRVFGLSFGLRLMEKGEGLATDVYGALAGSVPEMATLMTDEQKHEEEVLGLIEEERINYASAMVLGLNDALVELTGALAGLTLALRDGKLIAATGFITGVAASMSMAASAFLSSREEGHDTGKNPLKSAMYTGIAYIITVALLITPYLVLPSVYLAAGCMLGMSFLVILSYNFYITTAKALPFWRRSLEMIGISLSVAAISFCIGLFVRHFFNVEV